MVIQGGLTTTGAIQCTVCYQTSDWGSKENFKSVDEEQVLNKIVTMPISEWNYKAGDKSAHIGPMAQDFYAEFGLGTDNKHIATIDQGGVAFAAIKGLNQKLQKKLEEKDSKIQSLEERLKSLENRFDSLQKETPSKF